MTHKTHPLRRLTATLFSCLLLAVATSAAERSTLRVWFADGTTTDIQLYIRPQVTFEGDNVVISSPVATFTYDAQQVLRFTYVGAGTPTQVIAPNSEAAYQQDGQQLFFDVKVKASAIQLYSEDGKRVAAKASMVNGRPSLSLSNLPAGVYLLKVNGRTSKITKNSK